MIVVADNTVCRRAFQPAVADRKRPDLLCDAGRGTDTRVCSADTSRRSPRCGALPKKVETSLDPAGTSACAMKIGSPQTTRLRDFVVSTRQARVPVPRRQAQLKFHEVWSSSLAPPLPM